MIEDNKWFDLICKSYTDSTVTFNGSLLPKFPSDEIQINTTGQAGAPTLKEAFIFYQDCLATFAELGAPINEASKLLDFGVGWGRIARFFLREVQKRNLYGVDVMQDFVDICKDTFESNNFFLTTPFPPSELPSEKFNYIVGYSVFSHLSEKACCEWMSEFYRILVPGGIVAVTTRGRPFFDYCKSLRGGDYSGYLKELSIIFDDIDDARMRYDYGEFVHSNNIGLSGGGAMTSDYYGETFIPKSYAENAYKEFFTLENFLFNPERQEHPIMFFRKK